MVAGSRVGMKILEKYVSRDRGHDKIIGKLCIVERKKASGDTPYSALQGGVVHSDNASYTFDFG